MCRVIGAARVLGSHGERQWGMAAVVLGLQHVACNGNVSQRRAGDNADDPSSTTTDESLCTWSVTYANFTSPATDPVDILASYGMHFETSDGSATDSIPGSGFAAGHLASKLAGRQNTCVR